MNSSQNLSSSESRSIQKAYTEPLTMSREDPSNTSSSHSFDSSSSSSNSLSDEEIEFDQIKLHFLERGPANSPLKPGKEDISKIMTLLPHITSISPAKSKKTDSTAPSSVNGNNYIVQNSSESQCVIRKLVTADSKNYRFIEIEKSTIFEYAEKRTEDIILECNNYTKKDVEFLMETFKLNAILYWELLTTNTPGKYQKFGTKCSLIIINYPINLDQQNAKRMPPLKIVKLPKLTIIFTQQPTLSLQEILPENVEHITGYTFIYLVLQNVITQYEDLSNVLIEISKKIHEESSNTENYNQRKIFIGTMYELDRFLKNLKSELKNKSSFFKDLIEDDQFPEMFRVFFILENYSKKYLIRHLRGKNEKMELMIEESIKLQDIAKKQYDELVDQITHINNKKVDKFIQVITVFSIVLGVVDIIDTFYGMNVKLPGKDSKNYIPFALILSVAGVLCGILYFALKKFTLH